MPTETATQVETLTIDQARRQLFDTLKKNNYDRLSVEFEKLGSWDSEFTRRNYKVMTAYKGAEKVHLNGRLNIKEHLVDILDVAVQYIEVRLPYDFFESAMWRVSIDVYAASEYIFVNQIHYREECATLTDGSPGPEVPESHRAESQQPVVSDEVVERLKSKEDEDAELESADGKNAGRAWVCHENGPSPRVLERLGKAWDNNHQWFGLAVDFTEDQTVYFMIQPSNHGDCDAAEAFWTEWVHDPDLSPAFVRGFVEGALEAWDEAKSRM